MTSLDPYFIEYLPKEKEEELITCDCGCGESFTREEMELVYLQEGLIRYSILIAKGHQS